MPAFSAQTRIGLQNFFGLGNISKLFSEAVEAIDPRPVEGIRSTGAPRLQEIGYGIIPRCCRYGHR
jgi:ABC-type phosphate/phosphonate transport system permease subunit